MRVVTPVTKRSSGGGVTGVWGVEREGVHVVPDGSRGGDCAGGWLISST